MKYIFLVILLITGLHINGQKKNETSETDFYYYKNEVGINFTNVLGNVLSLNPNNANSPYSITFRRHGRQWTFRAAMNILYDANTSFDQFGNRSVLKVNNTQLSFGFQKTEILGSNFALGYGLDFVGGLEYELSEISTFNGTLFEATDRIWKVGSAPFLRLEYKLSQRVFLSTESSFYAIYGKKLTEIKESGFPITKESSNLWEISLKLPQSLFINIAF